MMWAATQAKAKFSEMLDLAESEGPQLVKRRKQEFYVVARDAHASANQKGRAVPNTGRHSLAGFLRNSSLKYLPEGFERSLRGRPEAPNGTSREKPIVSAWDALAPSFEDRYDISFPRLKGKLRKVKLG